MAAPDAESHPTAVRPLSFGRRVQIAASGALIVLGLVFYVSWGIRYGGWLDNGVYAVTIVLLLFGLVGLWLTMPTPTVVAPPTAPPTR